jgi:hypothetical protein
MQNGPQRPREVFFRPDDGGYLHSVLASREAMSAVPRNLAAVWGEHFRRPSAYQVGKLCRFGFRPQATKVSAKGRVPTYCGRCASKRPTSSVVKWAENQPDEPTLSEAIRRLVELGLTARTKGGSPNEGQKLRAREMAAKTIDRMADSKVSAEDQADRKRRLLKGPEEFRDTRVDGPKKK